jgi:hypothetical protein
MKIEKGQKIDGHTRLYSIVYVVNWIGGISMSRKMRGIRKIHVSLPWYWHKSFSIYLCIKRRIHKNHQPRLKKLGMRCR